MCPYKQTIDEDTSNNDDSEWIDLALIEDYLQSFNEQNLLSAILSNKLKDVKGNLLADQKYAMKYYYGQFLAHTLAYELSKPENDSFALLYSIDKYKDVLQEDGKFYKHNYVRLVVSNLGLVGYILYPSAQVVNATNPLDIKIIFRGTNPKSIDSINRDVYELHGAGAVSFMQNKNLILHEICETIDKIIVKSEISSELQPINITIAGHSLGGADAQHCLVAIMQAISQSLGYVNDENSIIQDIPFSIVDKFSKYCINKLRIFIYNSAGIPIATKESSIQFANFLYLNKQKKSLFQNLDIESYNYLVTGDVVQQTGEAYILNDVPKEHAKVDILKMENINGVTDQQIIGLGVVSLSSLGSATLCGGSGWIITLCLFSATATLKGNKSVQGHTKKILLTPTDQEINYFSVNNGDVKGQEKVKEILIKKSRAIDFSQNIFTSIINSIYYAKNVLIGESIKFIYINQPKVDIKLDNNYKLLELTIKNVHELMYACQANTRNKQKSYYGMLTYLRDKATSIWSLSDKVWYTCQAFLAEEIHHSNDYLQSFKLLQEELKAICSTFNNNSGIYTKLQAFLEKDLSLLLQADASANLKQDNKIDRSPMGSVSFLKSRFEKASSSSLKDIDTSSNAISSSFTKKGAA